MREISETLKERRSEHGDFTDHARIAQRLKTVLKMEQLQLSDIQNEALDMILHKIARIAAGNPNHKDHWHDIAGYAKLVEERIEEHDIDIPIVSLKGTNNASA